jgi:hypothetical protein
LIPNIVVDQIIDRKLAGLPDGKEKDGHVLERETKAAYVLLFCLPFMVLPGQSDFRLTCSDWKVLQSSIVPPKPPPARRTGRAMEVLNNLFEPMPHHRPRRPNPERRSTIDHFNSVEAEALRQAEAELEVVDPRRRSAYAGMSLAAATRRNMEDEAASRPQSAARRLATQTAGAPGEQSLAGYGQGVPGPSRPRLEARTSSTTTLEQHRMRSTTLTNEEYQGGMRARPSLQVRTGSTSTVPGEGSGVRRSITTSRALLNRQDRYRGNNRDNAVLVVSDSD